MTWFSFLIVALGSALGGSLRYLSSLYLEPNYYATIFVNLLGCFCIGICFSLSTKYQWETWLVLFILAGVLGGFTTFSSFSLDILKLLTTQQFKIAFIYMLISVFGGVFLAYLGSKLIA